MFAKNKHHNEKCTVYALGNHQTKEEPMNVTISLEAANLARAELFDAIGREAALGYAGAYLPQLLAAYDELSTVLGYDYEPTQITAARALVKVMHTTMPTYCDNCQSVRPCDHLGRRAYVEPGTGSDGCPCLACVVLLNGGTTLADSPAHH